LGLLTEIFLSRIKLPRDIHRYAFRKYPDRVALRFPHRTVTFAALQERSYRLVQALEAAGLKTGDSLFAWVETGPEFFEIRTAALEIGLVLSVFHRQHGPEFVAYAASKAHPRLMICDPHHAGAVPDLPTWITGGSYEDRIAGHEPAPSNARFAPDLPMGLGFTSGTTGAPKGLLSSHGAAVASLKLIIRNLKIKPDRKTVNISLPAIPLVGAGSGLILPSLLSGGELVVAEVPDAPTLVALIKAHEITRIFITPSQLIDLLDLPESADADLASLGHIVYGTSNMPLPKLEEAIRRFGPILQQGYGQAEVLPPVSLLTPEDHMQDGAPAPRAILRSCGRVVKGVSVRIVDESGAQLPPGEIGHIHVRTPCRLTSYLDPAQNEGVILDDGYFKTGDMGFVDAAGFLTVIDREADVITTPEGRVFPRLIEDMAHEHPAVKECCLVAVAGEPKMVVSLRAGQTNHADLPAEIRAAMEKEAEPWQLPKDITVLSEIPRSFLGKVLRKNVREKMSHAKTS